MTKTIASSYLDLCSETFPSNILEGMLESNI